ERRLNILWGLMKIEGFQGRNVSFQCSHRLAWAYDKYFCKDPCGSEKDRLATVKSGGRAESGRVTLVDSGDGSFTVTLSHLQLSDSHQKYWCGVDRPGLDTYTQIQLTFSVGWLNMVSIRGPGGASVRQPRLCQCAPGQLWLQCSLPSPV
uniref:Immunoglobulin V-set domain-containing protein n=1 Tax=Haplochromis burtoni TaxID=8153 RepID=A0A3Q2VPH0_HAPBU